MKRYSLIAMVLLNSACGAKHSSSDSSTAAAAAPAPTTQDNSTQPTSSLLLADNGAAGQAITSHIDLALGALAEEPTSDASGASLLSVASSSMIERYRNCTVTGATAVVDIDQSIERDHAFTGPLRSYDIKYQRYMEKTRT